MTEWLGGIVGIRTPDGNPWGVTVECSVTKI